jgi:uncharacterized protein YecE (DUF72 family)
MIGGMNPRSVTEDRTMHFHVGTSGYSYPEWKGTFYPEKLPTKQMLGFYAERFATVEINNTFYRMPTATVLESWASQVPAQFRFVLKAPQEITHKKRLKDCGDLVASLVGVAGVLKERLGPLLFQLPPNFGKDVPRLCAFLKEIPLRTRAAFEFRHATWFDDEVFGLLRERNAALCVADAEDDLEVPFVATADWGYLRLRRPGYDAAALASWADRMRSQYWTDTFVFFKHEDAGTGPKLATRLLELVAARSKVSRRRNRGA